MRDPAASWKRTFQRTTTPTAHGLTSADLIRGARADVVRVERRLLISNEGLQLRIRLRQRGTIAAPRGIDRGEIVGVARAVVDVEPAAPSPRRRPARPMRRRRHSRHGEHERDVGSLRHDVQPRARDDLRHEHLARVIVDRRGEAFISGGGVRHLIEIRAERIAVGAWHAHATHLARDETVPDAHRGGVEGEFHLPRGG